jgi:MFS family permease
MPIYAATSFAVLAWSFTLVRDTPKHVEIHGRLGAVGAVFREAPRFWGFLAAVLLVWTGFNGAWNFIALKIERGGGGPLLVGIGTALGGLMEVLVMRTAARLQARTGLRFVYVLGCCVYAVGFFAWGLIESPRIVSMLAILEGVAFGLLFTTGVVVIGRLLPSSLYSTGQSIAATVGFGIGPILGAGIGGVVYQRFGPAVLYTGASTLALSAAVAAWFALSTPALSRPRAEVEAVL